ncbi:GNAT family N-acetyltransferase [Paludibacterium purpuratum]|uniref:Acetyltransferase (GNAT) family protein n=1 Tax=Paludibacterium purpuratum TaxID=1144873 RepID=A0A4R7BCR3_9NEIS|nr:GNAT family N-acetyltransferase [Paludibacterium purpuratum]TDR81526.1 acetyltransferase (GNAT) family protein [Paludibacterium purpuratum]
MSLTAPTPLQDGHCLGSFSCTEPGLESWFKQRARKNQLEGASRCFVVCDGDTVVGYYALAAGSVLHAQASGSIRRNMPDPIPVVVLGRLAVHAGYQGRGLGADLLKDAILRSLRLAQEMGIRALLCHAINESAKRFYLHHGLVESPDEPMTLMLNLAKLARVAD